MINKFLKAKHWQLVLVTFGLPIIIQFIMIGSMVSNIASQSNPEPALIFSYMSVIPIVLFLFIFFFYGWFWSVAVGLQEKVPVNLKMKVKRFKIFFFIPLIYILMFLAFFGIGINIISSGNSISNIGIIGGAFAVIIPLHLFAMFCNFYCLYFVSKTFKTVELQREVSFGDFAGEFFMIWFFPIGIWIIQPKINKMIEN